MDPYLEQARANSPYYQKKAGVTPGASSGIDPRAWISEIGGTIGGIGGGLIGGPGGAAAGAAAGTALGKVLEQKVKGEAVKPRDLLTETALSALFAYGPVRAGKGLLKVATGKGAKKAAEKATGQVAKSAFTKQQLTGIDQIGKAWGIAPGVPVSKGTAMGPKKAFELQKFVVNKVKAPVASDALTVQQLVGQYSDDLGKNLSNTFKNYKPKFNKTTLTEQLRKAYEKTTPGAGQTKPDLGKYLLDAGSKPANMSMSQYAQAIKSGKIKPPKMPTTKPNTLISDINALIKDSDGSASSLWKIRRTLDEKIINFGKSSDSASTISESIARAARKVINDNLKSIGNVSKDLADYSTAQQILNLVGSAVKSPKGVPTPIGQSVAAELGRTAQKARAAVGGRLTRETGGQAVETAAQQAGRQRVPVRSSLLRQVAATGTRGLISPVPAMPGEQISITEDITGLGAEPTPLPIDPRLNTIRAAIVQDIQRTGGKNIKNIQIIAGAYGIDLTPLGLGTTKKSTLDAATKRQLAGIRSGIGVLNELENLITQAGGGAGRVGGGLLGIAGRVGLAPEARTFTAARNAYSTRLSKALGETGVLTDQDIARAREAIPTLTDSPREVQLKLASIRRIIQDAYNQLQAQFQ